MTSVRRPAHVEGVWRKNHKGSWGRVEDQGSRGRAKAMARACRQPVAFLAALRPELMATRISPRGARTAAKSAVQVEPFRIAPRRFVYSLKTPEGRGQLYRNSSKEGVPQTRNNHRICDRGAIMGAQREKADRFPGRRSRLGLKPRDRSVQNRYLNCPDLKPRHPLRPQQLYHERAAPLVELIRPASMKICFIC